jgi:5-methylcytosine-specific restriction endonuclease McrA
MPQRAPHYCTATPTCSNFQGECATHGTPDQRSDKARGTAQERGYTSSWAAYSKRFRDTHQWCGMRADGTKDLVNSRCARDGVTTAAECVDHTIPFASGRTPEEKERLKWDPANHMSACIPCNTWKASTLERRGVER